MKRFAFRLDKVLQLRKWRERLSRQRFADAHRSRRAALECLEHARSDAAAQNRELAGRLSGAFTAGDALIGCRFTARLRRDVAERTGDLERCDERMQQRRGELLRSSRERQTLDTLRSKRESEYRTAMERLEQMVLDEEAGRRHRSGLTDG